MTLEIENINPLAHAQWDNLILESNLCSFFHSYSWIKVLWEQDIGVRSSFLTEREEWCNRFPKKTTLR
jgi:cytidylate kinase